MMESTEPVWPSVNASALQSRDLGSILKVGRAVRGFRGSPGDDPRRPFRLKANTGVVPLKVGHGRSSRSTCPVLSYLIITDQGRALQNVVTVNCRWNDGIVIS